MLHERKENKTPWKHVPGERFWGIGNFPKEAILVGKEEETRRLHNFSTHVAGICVVAAVSGAMPIFPCNYLLIWLYNISETYFVVVTQDSVLGSRAAQRTSPVIQWEIAQMHIYLLPQWNGLSSFSLWLYSEWNYHCLSFCQPQIVKPFLHFLSSASQVA